MHTPSNPFSPAQQPPFDPPREIRAAKVVVPDPSPPKDTTVCEFNVYSPEGVLDDTTVALQNDVPKPKLAKRKSLKESVVEATMSAAHKVVEAEKQVLHKLSDTVLGGEKKVK